MKVTGIGNFVGDERVEVTAPPSICRNLAAFTPTCGYGYYPAYVSINRVEQTRDADVEIAVRGVEPSHGVCGPEARIRLTSIEFRSLMSEVLKRSSDA